MRNQPAPLLAMLLALLPAIATAQNIVPPPVAPPGVTQPVVAPGAAKSTPMTSLAPAPASNIIAPETVRALTPAASQAALIDVLLPPAPERPPTADLKPAAPKAKSQKVAKQAPPKSSPAPVVISHIVDDPFAGVTGTPVSDSQFNRFVFPEPVEGIYFNEGAPLPECAKDAGPQDPCKPIFLNGRHMMLLHFRAGAQGPVQMLVHLRSGRMITLNLAPTRGPGAVVRLDGAEDGASDARLADAKLQTKTGTNATGMTSTELDVALISRFARGDIPSGFDTIAVGQTRRYDLFDVIPMATWSNGANLRVYMHQIRAQGDTPVAINPGLFRGANVLALALDRDTITNKGPAILYSLEQLPAEEQ